MKHTTLSACIALMISAGVAAAATLGSVNGPALSAGSGAIAACDADGFTTTYTTASGNVTAVTVGGIADPSCQGASLNLTVTDASGASLASGGPQTIPVDGDAIDDVVSVSVSPNPLAEAPTAIEIVIAGP